MSIDKSLKTAGNLTKHNNVLSRAARITQLLDEGSFVEGEDSPYGLPKVAHRKLKVGGKKKKKEGEEASTDDASSTTS